MVNSIWGILVLGFTSSFLRMSSTFPVRITEPVVLYFTTFGLVEMNSWKPRVTWLVSFFCSSSFAFTSKKTSSVATVAAVLRSACRLLIVIETVTPETEYWGLTTADSSLVHIFFSYLTFDWCTQLVASLETAGDRLGAWGDAEVCRHR